MYLLQKKIWCFWFRSFCIPQLSFVLLYTLDFLCHETVSLYKLFVTLLRFQLPTPTVMWLDTIDLSTKTWPLTFRDHRILILLIIGKAVLYSRTIFRRQELFGRVGESMVLSQRPFKRNRKNISQNLCHSLKITSFCKDLGFVKVTRRYLRTAGTWWNLGKFKGWVPSPFSSWVVGRWAILRHWFVLAISSVCSVRHFG